MAMLKKQIEKIESDPANLRLYEAVYIRKYKPTLSSLEEGSGPFVLAL